MHLRCIWRLRFLARSHALFMEPASIENVNLILKLGPTALFTYLKIILL